MWERLDLWVEAAGLPGRTWSGRALAQCPPQCPGPFHWPGTHGPQCPGFPLEFLMVGVHPRTLKESPDIGARACQANQSGPDIGPDIGPLHPRPHVRKMVTSVPAFAPAGRIWARKRNSAGGRHKTAHDHKWSITRRHLRRPPAFWRGKETPPAGKIKPQMNRKWSNTLRPRGLRAATTTLAQKSTGPEHWSTKTRHHPICGPPRRIPSHASETGGHESSNRSS